MAYRIQCLKCERGTLAGNIADLIDAYTDNHGRLVCVLCEARETYAQQITGRWEEEPDAGGDEYIKGVLRLGTASSGYIPCVFLTARSTDGAVSRVRFTYYEAPGPNRRPTDGPGPGEAPALTSAELVQLLEKLGVLGLLDVKDLEGLASRLRRESPRAVAG